MRMVPSLFFVLVILTATSYCQGAASQSNNQVIEYKVAAAIEPKAAQTTNGKKKIWIAIVTIAVVVAVAGFVIMPIYSDP